MTELLERFQSLDQFDQHKLLVASFVLKRIGVDSFARLTLMTTHGLRRLRVVLRKAGFNYGESLEIANNIVGELQRIREGEMTDRRARIFLGI